MDIRNNLISAANSAPFNYNGSLNAPGSASANLPQFNQGNAIPDNVINTLVQLLSQLIQSLGGGNVGGNQIGAGNGGFGNQFGPNAQAQSVSGGNFGPNNGGQFGANTGVSFGPNTGGAIGANTGGMFANGQTFGPNNGGQFGPNTGISFGPNTGGVIGANVGGSFGQAGGGNPAGALGYQGNAGANGQHNHSANNPLGLHTHGANNVGQAGARGIPGATGQHVHTPQNPYGMHTHGNAQQVGRLPGRLGQAQAVQQPAQQVQQAQRPQQQAPQVQQERPQQAQRPQQPAPAQQAPQQQPAQPEPKKEPIKLDLSQTSKDLIPGMVDLDHKGGRDIPEDRQAFEQALKDQGYDKQGDKFVNKDKPHGQKEVRTDGDKYRVVTPVAMDLNQDGKIGTTGASTAQNRQEGTELGNTVNFDIDADGTGENIEWMNGDGDGLLVDTSKIKGNQIDGAALFGDQGGQYGNGYEKLSQKDLNGDSRVNGEELADLAVWVDDGDAVLEQGELQSLADHGITDIGAQKADVANEKGENLMRSDATANGQSMMTEDVWFGVQE